MIVRRQELFNELGKRAIDRRPWRALQSVAARALPPLEPSSAAADLDPLVFRNLACGELRDHDGRADHVAWALL